MSTLSEAEQLQKDIHGRLSDDPYFSNITVILFYPRSENELTQLQATLDQTLAGMLEKNGGSGAAVIVLLPDGRVLLPDVRGPRLALACKVRVLELAMINMATGGTGKTAWDIGKHVLQSLHQWYVGNLGSNMIPERDALVAKPDDRGRIIYDCSLSIPLGLVPPLTVPMPQITGTASAVTITCALAGAAILYTTDGSYPGTGGTPQTYTAPFAVASGKVVRAVASKTGYANSSGVGYALIN